MRGKEPQIDFIGIGARKAATTWLFRCLQGHPDIYVPGCKDTHFFDENYGDGIKKYKEYFTDREDTQISGEIGTTYLGCSKSAERIAYHFPDIKILIILRDPVQRALSRLRHLQTKKKLSANITIQQAIEQYPDIISDGLYASHIKRYLQHFSRDKIHIIFLEDIEKDPLSVIQTVYRFLGAKGDYVPKSIYKRYNTSKARNSRLFWIIQNVYFTFMAYKWSAKIIHYVKQKGMHLYPLEPFLNNCGVESDSSKSDEVFLYKYFEDDINALEKKLNVDLNEWKYEKI